MYHRVSAPRVDPFEICVKPEHFTDQVACLRAHFPMLSMDELAAGLKGSRLPKRAVVLTFDDGYADLLSYVAPVLASHKVPATTFVTVGGLGRRSAFWWDELARMLFKERGTPLSLQLTVGHETFTWHTQGLRRQTEMEIYYEIHRLLRPLSEMERHDALLALRSQSGPLPPAPQGDRPLSVAELRALASTGWMGIGAHTMTHPMLSAQPENTQRWEIMESRTRLEALVGESIDSFAYPHGDLGPSTAKLVRECGFRLAFTAAAGLVRNRTDTYRLPRLAAPDCDGAALCRQLDAWFAGRPPAS